MFESRDPSFEVARNGSRVLMGKSGPIRLAIDFPQSIVSLTGQN